MNAPQRKWPPCVWACRHPSSLQISWQKGSPPGLLPPWHLWVIKKICPLKGLSSSPGLLSNRLQITPSYQNVQAWWRACRLGTPSTSLSRSCGCSCCYYYFHFTDEEMDTERSSGSRCHKASESQHRHPILPPQVFMLLKVRTPRVCHTERSKSEKQVLSINA